MINGGYRSLDGKTEAIACFEPENWSLLCMLSGITIQSGKRSCKKCAMTYRIYSSLSSFPWSFYCLQSIKDFGIT